MEVLSGGGQSTSAPGYVRIQDGVGTTLGTVLAAAALIDAVAAPAGGLATAGFNYGFNGTTWDRIRTFAGNVDAIAAPATGLAGGSSFLMTFNGTTWDRWRTAAVAGGTLALGVPAVVPHFWSSSGIFQPFTGANNIGDGNGGSQAQPSFVSVFNGTTWDRARAGSAATLSGTTQPFATQVTDPGMWSVVHSPAAAAQATASKAAGAAGVRHVCRSITASIATVGTAQTLLLVNLRDGASGAGTILWTMQFVVPINSVMQVTLTGLNFVGSAATAMTLETTGATVAAATASVTLGGYSTI